jgi:hypothetical protein
MSAATRRRGRRNDRPTAAATLKTVRGQPSWELRATKVRAYLTRLGGHLGPVEFALGRRWISPLSVAPWAEENISSKIRPILRVLRGDFFCAPFGDNTTAWRGEKHLPHGEAANATWRLIGQQRNGREVTLHAQLRTTVREGRIDKFITLIDGQTAVYQRHEISGSGPMTYGHHAMVKFPDEPGSGTISTSGFVRGQVFPGRFGNPEKGSYQALKPGAMFKDLRKVPLIAGGTTDVSCFPARRGFDDALMLTADPRQRLAWTAVTFPRERYVWFSLRDPRQLGHLLMWISNGGRHFPPWNGRHTGIVGLEDITSYFQYGLAESVAANPVSRQGIPTSITLTPARPTVVNSIMALASIPPGFDRAASIVPTKAGVDLISPAGRRVRCTLDLSFLGLQKRALR